MIQWMSKKLKNRKGFTLIELIVVIAILGILVLIAIPRLDGFTTSAELRTDQANARVLSNVAQMIYAETGAFPDTLADFNVVGDYLDEVVVIQSTDKEFSYDNATGKVTVIDS